MGARGAMETHQSWIEFLYIDSETGAGQEKQCMSWEEKELQSKEEARLNKVHP